MLNFAPCASITGRTYSADTRGMSGSTLLSSDISTASRDARFMYFYRTHYVHYALYSDGPLDARASLNIFQGIYSLSGAREVIYGLIMQGDSKRGTRNGTKDLCCP